MGTSCSACLPKKVKDCAELAQNGAVTVVPFDEETHKSVGPQGIRCDGCGEPAEFSVSYFYDPKKAAEKAVSE